MGKVYVEALRAKRDEVMSEIERLRQSLADLEATLSLRENQVRNLDDLLALEDGQVPGQGSDAGPLPERRTTSFTDHVHQLLSESGRPVHYREIVRLLAERQIHVPGKDPGANLIAHLSRDDRFARVGRGTYGLAEWPSVTTSKTTKRRRRSRKVRATS